MVVDLVNYCLVNLVQDPERLEVKAEREDRAVVIKVRCAPEDAGRIIGRGGRVTSALRTMARAAADARQRVVVQLPDCGAPAWAPTRPVTSGSVGSGGR